MRPLPSPNTEGLGVPQHEWRDAGEPLRVGIRPGLGPSQWNHAQSDIQHLSLLQPFAAFRAA
jgi:hypothetical protein